MSMLYIFLDCPILYRQYRRQAVSPWEGTNQDEFAHLALIGYLQTKEWICRGNLISDKHVLTSYECVSKDSNYDGVALGNVNNILYGISKIVTNEKSLSLITLDKTVR